MRYARSAGPGDVGARIVLRRRTAGGGLSDVLGHVQSWADGRIVVRTRTTTVEVAEADVVAAKRVPDPPARR